MSKLLGINALCLLKEITSTNDELIANLAPLINTHVYEKIFCGG